MSIPPTAMLSKSTPGLPPEAGGSQAGPAFPGASSVATGPTSLAHPRLLSCGSRSPWDPTRKAPQVRAASPINRTSSLVAPGSRHSTGHSAPGEPFLPFVSCSELRVRRTWTKGGEGSESTHSIKQRGSQPVRHIKIILPSQILRPRKADRTTLTNTLQGRVGEQSNNNKV